MIVKKVLAIGGSDPSGGAGIQADQKTLTEIGVYGYTAVTAVTVQNSRGATSYDVLSSKLLRDQINAILDDGEIQGVKTGMLGNPEHVLDVANLITKNAINYSIIDPVIKASSGKHLVTETTVEAMKEKLLPLGFMVTPNIDEASYLSGIKIESENDLLKAARIIEKTGVQWVLIKGGHIDGDFAVDLLYDGNQDYFFRAKKVRAENVRGTGCMMASAICAYLVKGYDPYESVNRAKTYVRNKISNALLLGKGSLQALHFCMKGDADEDRTD